MKVRITEIMKSRILKEDYNITSSEEFEDRLLDLATLDLEDGQVRYPREGDKSYLSGGNNYDLYILNRDSLPSSGAFELIITDNDDESIGFIRGTKNKEWISFNLIHIQEEARGLGIGTDIYEKFLDSGLIIKSDKEITDDTYSMYHRLLSYGYIPIIFTDGRVGLKK